jgi:hypothetical protein
MLDAMYYCILSQIFRRNMSSSSEYPEDGGNNFLRNFSNHLSDYRRLQCTYNINSVIGHAIAHAVSRWLPTVAARVRARVWSCGICGEQSGAGACFLRVLRLPLPNFIPPIAPQSHSSIIWGLYNRPEVAAVPSRLSPTPVKKKQRDNLRSYTIIY